MNIQSHIRFGNTYIPAYFYKEAISFSLFNINIVSVQKIKQIKIYQF